MGKNRLEAFSDGVLAIIITIMVLEMKVPHGADWQTLLQLWPVFISYVLSFIYIGIYWSNHHHLLHSIHKVSGGVLWANLHLLFWLSLLPFSTGWMGENHFAANPTAVYGLNMLMSAVAYWILVRALIKLEGKDSVLAKAIGRDFKGNISLLIYLVGIASTFVINWIALFCYALVALIWLIPDKRIEKVL
jgi:uncharacterized membrane protein